ncbi:MAG: hypothetical protein E6J87_01770 [Deltaproteobacteria bacterium]|nr:MAG: hypothetical protein E6J87_01770 [Deltaproteobacteria bacterium]
MRWRLGANTALLALACVWGAACGSGGGHNTTTIITQNAFPQGFLPVRLAGAGGSGDVAFQIDGDLFAVDGSSDVTTVSRANGGVTTFAHVSGASLLSITAGSDGRLFAGDDAGKIWAIAANGSSVSLPIDTHTGQKITGLVFASAGFGDLGGQLLAAGPFGVLHITLGDTPQVEELITGASYVDLVFSGTTLFAVNGTQKRIDTVSASGVATSFATGFIAPIGIALDSAASELHVADAGDGNHHGVLSTVPVAGGAPKKRAGYVFDSMASGLAYDGFGAIAFVTGSPVGASTDSPHAIRGAALPRIDPASTNYGILFPGPTVGYGDLEFDRLGQFVAAGNAPVSTTNPTAHNFLLSTARDASLTTVIASDIGAGEGDIGTSEKVYGVAVDPSDQTIYVSTSLGNVWKRDAAGDKPTLLASVSSQPLLGLEFVPRKRTDQLVPFNFDPYSGQLVATTDGGHVFVISTSGTVTRITSSPIGNHLSDLVFDVDGTLYVLDNDVLDNDPSSHILRVAPDGTAVQLPVSVSQLGRPDGIEIDEGMNRLLVTSTTAGGEHEQLLGVNLSTGAVTALGDVDFDDGFFPTGVVYDRLGAVVLRQGDSSLKVVPLAPP